MSFQDKVKNLTTELDRVRKQAKEVCPVLFFQLFFLSDAVFILKISRKNGLNFTRNSAKFRVAGLCFL